MTLAIFNDDDGCARSIHSKCVQPTVTGNIIRLGAVAVTAAAYTAVMEVYYV